MDNEETMICDDEYIKEYNQLKEDFDLGVSRAFAALLEREAQRKMELNQRMREYYCCGSCGCKNKEEVGEGREATPGSIRAVIKMLDNTLAGMRNGINDE